MRFLLRSLRLEFGLAPFLAPFLAVVASVAGQERELLPLWERPEVGRPIDLQWSPAGAQLFVYLRPADVERTEPARRSLRALESRLGGTIDRWLALADVESSQLDSILWAIGPDASDRVQTIAIARLSDEQPALIRGEPALDDATGIGRWVAADRVIVMGPIETLREIREAGGQQLFLNRPLGQIHKTTNEADHLAFFGAPSFLLRDVPPWFRGDSRDLLEPLEQLLTEQTQAASFSLRVSDEETFAEVRMQMTLERRRTLIRALPEISATVRRMAADRWQRLQPTDAYWRSLSERWPTMLEFANAHVRSGWDGEQAVFNISVPSSAAHNLLLAGDLLLSEDPPVTVPEDPQLSIRELLMQRFDYEFGQRSFDDAFLGLAREVNSARPSARLKIVIDGPQLQRAGVTRNQELGKFAVGQKPVGQLLTLLTMRANPSRVARPSNPQQVVVWTIDTDPDDPKAQVVLITSRQFAEENRLVLPKYYREK